MTKYLMTALALKLFSLNSLTKATYRKIGNSVGAKRRLRLDPCYIDRGNWLVSNVRQFGIDARENKKFLELGTGWMHFYSTYLRLFFDFEGTLFDVWDNRQLNALKMNFLQVGDELSKSSILDSDHINNLQETIRKIGHINSFDEFYELLNMKYVISPTGSLDMFPDDYFDLTFSVDVLEHVSADNLENTIDQYYRIMKPGGYAFHQVGVDDHLAHYAPNASQKQYLAYSERKWNLLYKNDVQYFNRVSYDDFRKYFRNSGFTEVSASANRRSAELEGLKIAENFLNQSQESLEATRVFLIYQKPYAG